MGLHKKFIFLSALVLFSVIGISSWQHFELVRERIRKDQREKVEVHAAAIVNGLERLMLEGKAREFQLFIGNFVRDDIQAIRVLNEDGRVVNSSVPGEVGRLAGKDTTVYQTHEDLSIFSEGGGRQDYSMIIHIRNEQSCRKCHEEDRSIRGILDVEFSSKEMDRKIEEAAKEIFSSALLAAIILSACTGFLSNYIFRKPLRRITELTAKARGEDRYPVVRPGQADEFARVEAELGALVSALDRAHEELEKCRLYRDQNIEKMASLGELAAAVAHEIKNPLAGISGALQVLAEDFPEDSPRKEIASEVLEEIGRLDTAVKDLLIFARPPEPHLILIDINAIIEKVKSTVQSQAEKTGVDVRCHAAAPAVVKVDPDQIERAFLNIARHCIHSVRGDGDLVIETAVGGVEDEIEVLLSCSGMWIPEDKVEDVFKPLFSTKHSGTGLGLAISRSIIEGHKGRITVESRPGSGGTFHIFLPRKGELGKG